MNVCVVNIVFLQGPGMNITEIVAVTLGIGMALTLVLQWPWP